MGSPCLALAVVVVGGNRDEGDFLADADPAQPSDDGELDDVLHGFSSDRVRRNVLTDSFRAAHRLRASQKTEAPPMQWVKTLGRMPVFCLRA